MTGPTNDQTPMKQWAHPICYSGQCLKISSDGIARSRSGCTTHVCADVLSYIHPSSLSLGLGTVEVVLVYARLLRRHAGTFADLPAVCGLCDQLENWKSTAEGSSISLIESSKPANDPLLPSSFSLTLDGPPPPRDVDMHDPLIRRVAPPCHQIQLQQSPYHASGCRCADAL
jgi:hypothetical protein